MSSATAAAHRKRPIRAPGGPRRDSPLNIQLLPWTGRRSLHGFIAPLRRRECAPGFRTRSKQRESSSPIANRGDRAAEKGREDLAGTDSRAVAGRETGRRTSDHQRSVRVRVGGRGTAAYRESAGPCGVAECADPAEHTDELFDV